MLRYFFCPSNLSNTTKKATATTNVGTSNLFLTLSTRPARPYQLSYSILPSRGLKSSSMCNSGHNKWSKIRHNKAIQDSKKNMLYSRLAKEIIIAVRTGGSPDPNLNAALSVALKKAKAQGLPKANIDKTLVRASGGGENSGQQVIYEVMTNDKVGLMIQCVTDNPARARSTIYEIVKDNGARFTPTAFLFNKRAVVRITLPKEQFDQELEKLWDVAIELGVDDILPVEEEESAMENVEATDEVNRKEVEILASPDLLSTISIKLSQPPYSYTLTESELQWRPADAEVAKSEGEAQSEEGREKLQKLVEELEESPECVGVWVSIA